jgi:hypothetical protein
MKDIRRTVMIVWQLAIFKSGNFMQDAGNLFITHRLVGFKERKILLFEANEMLSYAAITGCSCPRLIQKYIKYCVAKEFVSILQVDNIISYIS